MLPKVPLFVYPDPSSLRSDLGWYLYPAFGWIPSSSIGWILSRKYADAAYEVILYDFYANNPNNKAVFFEQDYTCKFICNEHAIENEAEAKGERLPRATLSYPYTNLNKAQGFTIYKPL